MIASDSILTGFAFVVRNIGVFLCKDDSNWHSFEYSKDNLEFKCNGFYKVDKKRVRRFASLVLGELGRLNLRVSISNVSLNSILILKFYDEGNHSIWCNMGTIHDNLIRVLPPYFREIDVIPSGLPSKVVRFILFLSNELKDLSTN